MADLLTKVLEAGLGLVIVGLVVGIVIAWVMKFKKEVFKKQKESDTIKALRKIGGK